jgi:hypothetical protein
MRDVEVGDADRDEQRNRGRGRDHQVAGADGAQLEPFGGKQVG